jgi:hypothetical protein
VLGAEVPDSFTFNKQTNEQKYPEKSNQTSTLLFFNLLLFE